MAPRGLLLVQPERQRRLDLDEGLDSPYAEQVLRARDPDGRLAQPPTRQHPGTASMKVPALERSAGLGLGEQG